MDKNLHHISAEFKPAKSGIFTLGSLLIAAVLMVLGASYIAETKYLAGFLLFLPGGILAVASYFLGFRSSKDQDLEGGAPFQITANNNSYQISADARVSQELLLSLISASASTMRDRKPLPEPSGMVDASGNVDASKKLQASEAVATINQELENDLKTLESAVTTSQKIDQSVIENAPKFNPPHQLANERAHNPSNPSKGEAESVPLE